MVILNSGGLCRTKRTRDAVSILESGLAAADPASIIPRFVDHNTIRMDDHDIDLSGYDAVYTVAFGKAADSMSRAAARVLRVKSGMIVVPRDSKPATRGSRFRVHRAGHPQPDRRSVSAAKAVIKFLSNRRADDFVLFLVSGGASSLLALPDGITLSDKMHATGELLRCGAAIGEINCVRKHISGIKGGRLLNQMPCEGASLVMSDVEGDDPGTIASGTTHMDPTTFADALQVLEKYDLTGRVHHTVIARLQDGVDGLVPETPKAPTVPHRIIANNATCTDAMAERARAIGYRTETARHYGDVSEVAGALAESLPQKGGCLVFGGEPTVRVRGRGRGGRNQELVLRMLEEASGPGVIVASMGTDGIDGNTRSAGAIHEGPAADPPYIESCLAENDSHSYFERYGGLINTGHTGTNLLDIGVILSGRPSAGSR